MSEKKNDVIKEATETRAENAELTAGITKENLLNEVEYFQQFIGQKCAFLCCRYQYRGKLSSLVVDNAGNLISVILADATSVEVTGAAANSKANTEDPILGSVTIKNDAWEIFYQPNWCFAALPSEPEWEEPRTNN